MLLQKFSFLSSRVFSLLLVLLWMGIIFSFSTLQGQETTGPPPFWFFIERKGAHVVEYAVLMILSVRFWYLTFPNEKLRNILWLSGVFSLSYAATDELHQFFVPLRGAHFQDVLIDGGGIILAGLIIFFLQKTKNRPSPLGGGSGRL